MGKFQNHLIAAIAARPDASCYDCWVSVLWAFVIDHGVVTARDVDEASGRIVIGVDAPAAR